MEVFTACHEHLHAITFGTFNSVYNKEKFLEGPVTDASGMTLDQNGNFYLTDEAGVTILNSQGEQIEVISIPQMPTNIGFGGADGNNLFITVHNGLYSLRKNVTASR